MIDADELLLAAGKVALSSPTAPKGRIEALVDFATLCTREGETAAAEMALAEAVTTLDSARGSGPDQDLAAEAHDLAKRTEGLHQPHLARQAHEVSFALVEDDPKSPLQGIALHAIARCWQKEGNPAETLRCLRRAAEVKRDANDHRSRVITLASLIEAETRWGRSDECDLVIAETIHVLEEAAAAPLEQEDDTSMFAHQAGRASEVAGRPPLARKIYELTLVLQKEGTDSPRSGIVLHDVANTWLAQGEGRRAIEAFREASELKRGGSDRVSRLITLEALAKSEARWGESDRCELAIAEAAEVARECNGEGRPETLARIGREMQRLALELRRTDLATGFYGIASLEGEVDANGSEPSDGER